MTVVVITGASAGVGRATARAFAREGASLALIARGEEALEATRREVEALGGRALVIPLDVADAARVAEAALRVEEELGPIDVWVNNAMVSVFSPVKLMRPEEYERVTRVTYLGYVNGTLAALEHMLPRNRGVIVQVGSALTERAIPLQSAYCAAKHAIEGFTESLRSELRHDGSRVEVTLVQLPALNTPQFSWVRSRMPYAPRPVPPIYQPEVAARAIVWASKHPRRELRVGATTVAVMSLNRLVPALGDRFLARFGFTSQQTRERVKVPRRDNLFAPVPEDRGARGPFRAAGSSLQLWLDTHRGVTALIVAGLAGAAFTALRVAGARQRA